MAQSNYDGGFESAVQMACMIGGFRRYKNYEPYSLDSVTKGDLEFTMKSRPIFEDARVREALVMAFDFEWANANLFNNAYRRTYGYYGGSELSSEGKPVDDAERQVLGDALAKLKSEFVDGSYK